MTQSDFIKEYFEQDNFGTAYPIYFVIRDLEWVSSYHRTEGDRFVFVFDTDVVETANTLTALFKKIKADVYYKFPKDFDFEYCGEFEIDSFLECNEQATGIFAEKKKYVNKNMFLLKSEAEQHLKVNHYHYSEDAFVYCKHAWRTPRQEKFFSELKKLHDSNN